MKNRKSWKKAITALMIGSQIVGIMSGYGMAGKVYAEESKDTIKIEMSSSGYGVFPGNGNQGDDFADMEFPPEGEDVAESTEPSVAIENTLDKEEQISISEEPAADMVLPPNREEATDIVQGAPLNLSTTSFQMSDIRDSSKVSTFNGADGKQAVIVFGWVTTCDFTVAALRNLTEIASRVDMSQLNIYVFLIERPSKEDILSKLDNVSEQIMVNTLWNYEENKENEEYSNLFNKCSRAISNAGGFSMPMILYKGIDGTVYEHTTGYATGQTDLDTIAVNVGKGGLDVAAKIEPPTFSEIPYIGGKDISFTCATKDAIIYYSTTGSSMTTKDKWVANGGKVTLGGFNGTVYARAYYDGQWSDLASYVVKTPQVAAPTITVSGNKVTIKAPTSGSTIYYTIDGSIPTVKNGIKGKGEAVSLDSFAGMLKAIAVKNGYTNSDIASYVLTAPKVATPTISISEDKVKIEAPTSGSVIYYTIDGSTPTVKNGIKGNGASVTLDSFAGTLKAIAVKNGWTNSDMARKVLVNSVKSHNVSFKVKGVFGGRNVTFGSELKGAKVYYSSATSRLTTSDKCVDAGSTVLFENFYGTIYARTYYNGEWGNVCRLILKIPVVNAPTISVDSKGYATIRTTTPKSRIYYTTDGTTPSMSNGKMASSSYVRVYVGKSGSGRIRAIAVRSCFTNSYECACTWKWTSY